MNGWYENMHDTIGAYVNDNVAVQNIGHQSQALSGPREPSNDGFVDRPWSGGLCF